MAEPTTNGEVAVDEVEKAVGGMMTEIGRSGLYTLSGYVYEDFIRELVGSRAIKTYREMKDNDSVVGGVLFAIEMLIRGVEWRVEPAEEDGTGELADFIEGALHDMSASWEDTLSAILTFLQYGWAYCEEVYKLRAGPQSEASETPTSQFDDGRVGWRKLALRSQDTLYKWEFDDSGGLQGMWQQAPPAFEPVMIPIQKALLFRTSTGKGSPEGRSVLRSAYLSYYNKRTIQTIESIGVERDLAGLPVMEVPIQIMLSDATNNEKTTYGMIQKTLRNIKRNEQEGIVIPQQRDKEGNKMYELSLLSTGGRRQFDTDAIVARYDQRMAMSVLADFILLGHERIGSQALSVSKIGMFTSAIGAWVDSIADVFNSYAIPRLLRLNGIDPALSPKLTHAEIEKVDLAELGAYVANLAKAGIMLAPDPATDAYLRGAAGLPEDTQASPEM